MSNDVLHEPSTDVPDSGDGPLRHFRIGRRLVLQSLATGAGVAAFASTASAASAHAHHAAAAATTPAAAASTEASALVFLDQHAFDTLAVLGDQIVPGSRAAKVPEFLDRLLAVESLETQKRFTQALGAFEQQARAAHAKPWKSLTAQQATALLTQISTQPDNEPARRAFENLKRSVVDAYYTSEAGLKDLGWDGSVTFAPPTVCA